MLQLGQYIVLCFLFDAVAELQQNTRPLPLHLKQRRVLKGHFGKIYALHWSKKDSVHIVSASQDGKLIVRFSFFFCQRFLMLSSPSLDPEWGGGWVGV